MPVTGASRSSDSIGSPATAVVKSRQRSLPISRQSMRPCSANVYDEPFVSEPGIGATARLHTLAAAVKTKPGQGGASSSQPVDATVNTTGSKATPVTSTSTPVTRSAASDWTIQFTLAHWLSGWFPSIEP